MKISTEEWLIELKCCHPEFCYLHIFEQKNDEKTITHLNKVNLALML